MRKLLICIILALFASACQPTPTVVLPTLVELPTDEVTAASEAVTTEVSEATATIAETEEVTEVTEAATLTSTPTITSTPTVTRTPTNTPPPQPTATVPTSTPNAHQSETAAVEELPIFTTITPAPPNAGVLPTTTPIIVADVTITEQQFQEELDSRITEYPDIESAFVSFAADGVHVTLTASGGDALITGDVTIAFQVSDGLVYISISAIQINAQQIPPTYQNAINDLYQAVIASMDGILRQQLGDATDLENVIFTDSTMNITLLVPLSVATTTP